MDSFGVDNTINTWNKMWEDHNNSLDSIHKVMKDTSVLEDNYYEKKVV